MKRKFINLQDWVSEMAAYVKSIDNVHLLQVGLEGFYGRSMAGRLQYNPGYEGGTDFISNNLVPEIDYATIHIYPTWYPTSLLINVFVRCPILYICLLRIHLERVSVHV